jgi:biotin transport system substrate-specific component
MNTLTKSALSFVIAVFAGSLFIAASARIAIPLPFTLVPITLQTFMVCSLATFFGPRIALGSVLAYLAEASCGLPVLAFGASCPLWFLTPRVGYLVGFIPAVWCVGKAIERFPQMNLLSLFLLVAASQALILLSGMLFLIPFVGLKSCFWVGFAPFIIGDLVKAGLVTVVTRSPVRFK